MEIRKCCVAVFALVLAGCSSRHPVAAVPPAAAPPPPAATVAAATPSSVVADRAPSPSPIPPNVDPIDEVVAAAEKEYLAAQSDLKIGNVDSAKADFDRGLTILTETSSEIQSDPRVQEELSRIQDGVKSLNSEAANVAGTPQQKTEPAPIDEANEVTYPVDPNIKAKAAAEIKATHSDLPLMLTDPVAGYINYFSNRGRGTLEHALARSGRYQEMIQRILREEGLPQDLIYLAQAESGFHPLALSRAGARGIWQFMAVRAKGYGLERNVWVDERQDPEKATRAAAHHLKDLYNQFGDWYLAMAAYNSGPGTVQSAVKRTGFADFWELYKRDVLPKETRNYIPIILAETIMAKNPSQYGLEEVVRDQPVPYDAVKVNYAVDLRLVAECVNATPETLEDLNPSLLRMMTPKNEEFTLRLPAGTRDTYLEAIAAIPREMRLWWRYHSITPGDTLYSLARFYHSSPRAILQANKLTDSDPLQPGAKIIIPVVAGKRPLGEGVPTYAKHATIYKVRKGDTVQSVADNFGVSPLVVRRWNHLKGDSLRGRRIVYVHMPVNAQLSEGQSKRIKINNLTGSNREVRHAVKPGETLYSIAITYKTTIAAIKESNRNVATLRPGMILLIPANE